MKIKSTSTGNVADVSDVLGELLTKHGQWVLADADEPKTVIKRARKKPAPKPVVETEESASKE